MNLIEKLGGYEEAKNIYDKAPPQSDNYADGLYYEQWQSKSWVRFDGEQCTDCKKPENPIHLYSLYLALLKYRRQHNIFEVGDRFVIDGLFGVFYANDGNIPYLDYNKIRHATDAEIKAGRRLPVIESDDCSDIRNHISPNTVVIDHAT